MKKSIVIILYIFLILFTIALFDVIYMLYLREPPPYPIMDPYSPNESRLKVGIIVISILAVLSLISIRIIDKKISLKNFFFASVILLVIWILIFVLFGMDLVPFNFLPWN